MSAVVFFLLRLLFLDQLFLLHDERDIVLSGYSVAKTGHDLFGNFLPISFAGISPDNPLVSIYYSAVWWLVLPIKSVFFARLPFVLISTLLMFLVYEIVRRISDDKRLAFISALIFCFSPWVFHITRLAMDLPLAAVTLFGAILFYLKERRWLSYLLFFLTFYNYQGFRVVIPFLVVYLELIKGESEILRFTQDDIKIFIRRNIINVMFIVFLFVSISFIDKAVTTKRFSQVAFLSPERFTAEVNTRRAASNVPLLIRDAFHNKITVAADYVVDNFVKGQDISYLFKTGDYSPINGNAVGGQFFFVFLLFFYLGIMALGRRLNRKDFYLIGFIFLGLLPAMASVNSATYSIRGFVSALGYAYLLALGVDLGIDLTKRMAKTPRYILYALLMMVMAVNGLYFTYNFYERKQVTVGELFNENEKRVSQYLLDRPEKQFTVYHDFPKNVYLSYIFMDSGNSAPQVTGKDGEVDSYTSNNVVFMKCPKLIDYATLTNTLVSESCMNLKTHDQLNSQVDLQQKILYKDLSLKTAYFIFE
ncbi:MAG: glycosyltransferase family 39 protein [Microgenomates group bacterium]